MLLNKFSMMCFLSKSQWPFFSAVSNGAGDGVVGGVSVVGEVCEKS